MATQVIIPQFGTSAGQATILNWLKNEGERVNRVDVLCEVETDKSAIEIEAFADGVLLKRLVEVGSEVETGAIIAYIGESGEVVTELPAKSVAPEQPEQTKPNPSVSVETLDAVPSEIIRPKATPRVRRLAKELGVDLSTISATGKADKITENDVKKAAGTRSAPGAADLSLSRNQLAVARRLRKSHEEIIPLNVIGKINMSSVITERESLYLQSGRKTAYDAFFIYAVSRTLKHFPRLCRFYDNEKLIGPGNVNVGVAISTQTDLYIPVVKNAAVKNLTEIDKEISVFVEKTHTGTLSAEEMTGGVFTISNLGMYPVQCFNVIIPPQQSGALAIGSIEEVPVFKEKTLTTESVVTVMLSVDHRFINGRLAGEFFAKFKGIMEQL